MKTQMIRTNDMTPRPFFGGPANDATHNLTGTVSVSAVASTHDHKEVSMKTQLSKQHTNVVAVQPLATFQKEDRMKKQDSTTGERMTMSTRSIAIAVAFFLLAIASIPAYAWQADRLGMSSFWIITCNDGTAYAGIFGPDGPDFSTGFSICAKHGGIAAPPKPGTRSLYGLSIPVDVNFLSPVTVEDLFLQGQISSQDGFRLTNTFDQEVWARTFLEFSHVPIGANTFEGVFVIGVATLIPPRACNSNNLVFNGSFETGDFTGWTIGGSFGDKTRVVSGPFYAYPGAEDGQFYAALGPVGSDGTLSQTLATTAGANYTFSFWMASVGDDPSDFSAKWNGSQVFSQTDPNTGGAWTQSTFSLTGTGSDTISFSFRDDPGYIALDNVSVCRADIGGKPKN